MYSKLSAERLRSSTTSAIERCTCSFDSFVAGGGGGAGSPFFTTGWRGRAVVRADVCTGTNRASVMSWTLPSCRSSKSFAVRSVTMRPSLSVTTASMRTASTPTRKTG